MAMRSSVEESSSAFLEDEKRTTTTGTGRRGAPKRRAGIAGEASCFENTERSGTPDAGRTGEGSSGATETGAGAALSGAGGRTAAGAGTSARECMDLASAGTLRGLAVEVSAVTAVRTEGSCCSSCSHTDDCHIVAAAA